MFPQVAPEVLRQRAEGPKNVGKAPAEARRAAAPRPPPRPATARAPITAPVTYEVRIGDKSHKVTVEPA